MRELPGFLEQWQLDDGDLRRRIYWAPTPRERERWHALWLLVQGWTAVAVAEALGRDAHTIGRWVAVFGEGGPGRCLRAVGWFPPAIDGVQQTELKAVVQEFPAKVDLDLANWNWKVVRRFVQERFEVSLSRRSCLNYPRLHEGRLCTAWDLC